MKKLSILSEISDYNSAISAVRQGAIGLMITVVTAIIYSLYQSKFANYSSILNTDLIFSISVIIGIIFYMYFGSKIAVFIGMFYYCVNLIGILHYQSKGPSIVSFFVLILMINSVRGVLSLKKFSTPNEKLVVLPTPTWINYICLIIGLLFSILILVKLLSIFEFITI